MASLQRLVAFVDDERVGAAVPAGGVERTGGDLAHCSWEVVRGWCGCGTCLVWLTTWARRLAGTAGSQRSKGRLVIFLLLLESLGDAGR